MADKKHEPGSSEDKFYTTDLEGNRVLYGLTFQETQELHGLRRYFWTDRGSRETRLRRKELTDKHDRAVSEVIGAQIEMQHKPQIH
jgi:hypothetical protein